MTTEAPPAPQADTEGAEPEQLLTDAPAETTPPAPTDATTTTEETPPPEKADAETPESAPPSPPDAYSLVLPEGLDASDLPALEAFAREHKMSNEQAQTLVNALPDAYGAQSQRFRTESEAHPEIGGTKLAQAQALANRALDKFLPNDSPEGVALRHGLELSGYGNFAPLVVLLSRIGKAMAEDTPPTGAPSHGGEKTVEQTLYDNTPEDD